MKGIIAWMRRKTTGGRSGGTAKTHGTCTDLYAQALRARMALA